jgi:methylated-DNA-[protein]-cysteine S-methyltransferase
MSLMRKRLSQDLSRTLLQAVPQTPYSRLEVASPLGSIELTATTKGLISLYFGPMHRHAVLLANVEQMRMPQNHPVLAKASRELAQYFEGKLHAFTVPLDVQWGTPFQRKVWQALSQIPFAATCSYADIAERIGNPKAVRAVGLANGKNPISIIVPCHRVIGKNGTLTGYGGGLANKEWLLAHETRGTRQSAPF